MNNKLIDMQKMLFDEMKRLSQKNVDNNEISRSNSLANTALTYIKSINLGLRIKDTAERNNTTSKALEKELGLND